jgi:hypothetical protein
MAAPPDPLVLARIQKIAETTDAPSLVQAYIDLLTFGPSAFATLLAVIHGNVALTATATHSVDATEAILGALPWLGHRYPDELFAALGEPRGVDWTVAFSIESIDDPRTTEILLDVVTRQESRGTSILLPALVRRRDERVLPLLERCLFSTNRAVRLRAAEGLYVMHRGSSSAAIRPALDAEPDAEVRAILTDALARIDDQGDDRDLRWFWVVVRPRLAEYGVAALDADDALTVLGLVRYPDRELPSVRSVTDLDAPTTTPLGSKHAVGLPAHRGMWSPHDTTVWRAIASPREPS